MPRAEKDGTLLKVARVAQLDRVTASEAAGCGFDSRLAHHFCLHCPIPEIRSLGRYLSYLLVQNRRMKNRFIPVRILRTKRLIATFGTAQLYTNTDGHLELAGGTREDITAAKEWMSLFMHEAVPYTSWKKPRAR